MCVMRALTLTFFGEFPKVVGVQIKGLVTSVLKGVIKIIKNDFM